MYVAITGKGKSRVIQFCEQHRIAKTNKKKTVVIKTIGNYETLLKENPNIIFELKEKAKRLTKEKKKNISKKNTEDKNDEPIVNTTETKVNREVSKIYTSDKIDDENVEAKDGKYLYLELAEDKDSDNKTAQNDMEDLKISVSQNKKNYFTNNSKSFNVNNKS